MESYLTNLVHLMKKWGSENKIMDDCYKAMDDDINTLKP